MSGGSISRWTIEHLRQCTLMSTYSSLSDIEQVLREKKLFTLRCMLDGIKELQRRVAQWNRFESSVSIISA